MDPIRLVEFDIHGTKPVNKIPGEKIELKDKTLNWIIPNGSPFFAEAALTTVRDQSGARLVLGRDYFFEGEFIPFCAATGRDICSFIRLSNVVVATNTHVTVDYQSIGAWFVPRNDLEAWLKEIHEGNVPIPWSKIFGVPPTLPPSFHKHSIKTEIGDWYEMTYFFSYLAGVMETIDLTINQQITDAVDQAYARLRQAKTEYLNQIVDHDENYHAPHLTTKFDIVMGNHPNWFTATFAEQMAGVRNDVLSTPLGVQELAKQYIPNTDKAMKSGIMPISQFGGDTFIPPNISGSFEGMGQQTECSGICLEPNGMVTLLSNHNDGRTKGLYFSTIKDYNKDSIRITYTNYKYNPPVLAALGIDVDRIIAGSGNKVIMVGVLKTNDWFIALTNGSFDPGAHSYVRCDMSAITAFFGSPYGNAEVFGNHDQAVIHHMGAYLVFIQSWVDNGIPKSRFYRVLTEDVRAGRNVTWQAMPLTYVDWDGTQFNGVLDFVASKPIYDGSGKIARFGRFQPNQPFNYLSILRRNLSLSWAQTGGGGNHFLHIHHYFHMHLLDNTVVPPYTQIVAGVLEMFYIINPSNGAMALQSRSPAVNINFQPGADGLVGYRQYQFLINNLVSYRMPSTVVTATGELLSAHSIEGQGDFPVRFQCLSFTGINSGEGLMSRVLDTDNLTVKKQLFFQPPVTPATKNGCFTSSMTYETDGEVFEAVDQSNSAMLRTMYYRKVSGGYAIRDGINNLYLGPNIYSRALTTEIYKTNLRRTDGVLGITGSGAELAAAGVEMGSGSMSFCSWSTAHPGEFLPELPTFRAPVQGNVLMSFPRTYTKSLDAPNKEATYSATSFYGFRQNVVDQLRAYAAGTRYEITINHLGAENGGIFRGLNLSVISVTWIDEPTGRYRTQTLIARPNVEAPGGDHPGVYLITSFTILSAPPHTSTTPFFVFTSRLQFEKYGAVYIPKPYLTAYRDGSNLKISMVAGHAIVVATADKTIQLIMDVNINNGQVVNLATGAIDRDIGEPCVMWPGIGMTDVTVVYNDRENNSIENGSIRPYQFTGGGAAIHLKTGVGYIMPTSVYPETGWVLFCQPNIRMMVNGTMYEMDGGTIDLRDVDPAPQNKTFYLYAAIENDKPFYIVTVQKLRASGSLLKAATIVTNDKQILTITRHQPFMIGQNALSYTREGGIIPVSSGYPQDEGVFPFLRNAELLP